VEDSSIRRTRGTELKGFAWTLVLIWTVFVGAEFVWDISRTEHSILDVASIHARSSFQKDLVYRRWAASQGGIYVPATETTPPSPYLTFIDEQNISTPSGRPLTLMNPAYMTRQVHELGKSQYGLRGHITSLNPIRPENAPDPWEREALTAFVHGASEVSSIEEIDGEEYLRLMRPMIAEPDCLKCHAHQGYTAGSIRGGISVSVPMAPLRAVSQKHVLFLAAGQGALWLLGLTGIKAGTDRLRSHIRERDLAEESLREAHVFLERRVEERTAQLQASNLHLKEEIREREQAEAALWEQSRILEAFFKHTVTPLVFLDREFNFMRVNEAYAKADERDISEFPGHNHFEFYPSDAQEIFEEVVRTRKPFQVLARPFQYHDHPERGVSYWNWTLVPILDNDREVEFLVFSLMDVTKRIRAEQEVLELHRQLAEISDQERRRIGQELHDNLGQQLTGVAMLLKSLHQKLEAKGLLEAESTSRLLSCVREAQSQARSLARGLIPVQVDGKGLMAALEDLVETFSLLSGVR
jgi:PAS domain S-box-containing protein